MFQKSVMRLSALWCGVMHESLMWPIHGEYQCRTCGRRYPALRETPEYVHGVRVA